MDFNEIQLPPTLKNALHASTSPDDLYATMENQYNYWHKQQHSEKYTFINEFDLWLASVFLESRPSLLPYNVIKAIGSKMQNAMDEASNKKYSLESLFISPPKPGRKSVDNHITLLMISQEIMLKGKDRNEVYVEVAKTQHKSVDTIRRMYERHVQYQVKKFQKTKEYYYGKIKK